MRFGFFAGCDRLFLRHFFTIIIVIDPVAGAAGDLHTTLAIGPEAVIAHQRTNAPGLALDGVERIDTRGLRLKFQARMLVEQLERALGGRVPVAIDRTGAAANATKLGLKRAREIDLLLLFRLFSRWRQRRKLLLLLGRRFLGGQSRLLRRGGLLLFDLLGLLRGEPDLLLLRKACLFGGSRLVLFDLLGFLGSKSRLFRSLRRRSGLGLFRLLRSIAARRTFSCSASRAFSAAAARASSAAIFFN